MKKPNLNHAALAFAVLALVITACGKISAPKPAANLKQKTTPPGAAGNTNTADPTVPDPTATTLAQSIKDIKMTILAANTSASDTTSTTAVVDDTNEAGDVGVTVTAGTAAGKVVTLSLYYVSSKVKIDQDDTGTYAYPKPFAKLTGTIATDGSANLTDSSNPNYTAQLLCKQDDNNCKTSAITVTQVKGNFQAADDKAAAAATAAGNTPSTMKMAQATFRHVVIDKPVASITQSTSSAFPNGPLAKIVAVQTLQEMSKLVLDEVATGRLFIRYDFKFKDPNFDKESGSLSTESGASDPGVPAQVRFYTKKGTAVQVVKHSYSAGVNFDSKSENILVKFNRDDGGIKTFNISASGADLSADNSANTTSTSTDGDKSSTTASDDVSIDN